MKYFDRKYLPTGGLYNQHHRLAVRYAWALGLIGLLALACLGLLIAQVDSQGRYARMIDKRETQRFLTLHAALFSTLLGPEPDPARREQYRRTVRVALEEIEGLQRSFPSGSGADPAAGALAARLSWFAAAERQVLGRPGTVLAAAPGRSPGLSSYLATVPGAMRAAFDNAIESERGAGQRLSLLYQRLAGGAVCLLLLTLLAEARWIFQPLAAGIRRETLALAESRQRLDAVLATAGDGINAAGLPRSEIGRLTLVVADFDLRQLVEGAADVVAGRAVQKQLELLAFVAPEVPTALRGDAARLRQVLLNLLDNALEFTRAGEVIVEVSLEAAGAGEAGGADRVALRFAVRDTGCGIAPADRVRLFDAAAQPGEFAAERAGGRGMGLTICRQLIERMGGGIDCASEPGSGSAFWFTACLEKQPARPEGASEESARESARIASLSGVRILVVDDNASCRRLVSARLAAWGLLPMAAESGGAALALLREQALAGKPFGVALLDLNLGSMDGFTLAWAIHSQPMLAQTRLVLVTALGLEKDRAAYRDVGILGSVSKPLKHGAVLEVLAKVMAEEDPVIGTMLNSRLEVQPVRTPRINMVDAPLRAGGRRILLADDNPINRKMTLRQLTNLGFAADAVANGREALAALRAQPYGLVILDMHMPVLDGYETARTIRRLLPARRGERGERAEHLALVAMTANRTSGDRQRCLDAGMDDYLPKPVRQEDLGRMLTRWQSQGTPLPRRAAAATSGAE